ncbi:MAG: GSCFA domain-containing protein, partial [Eudoraea sp.]|nr:GSCFA domain-containing protein [Eudoraea sp.]
TSEEKLLEVLNHQVTESLETVTNTSHIFITLGSAWGYQLKETGKWVANCHKVPHKQFNKELWDVDALQLSLGNILDMIAEINPAAKVVFSVSPVRHIKDGFLENQRSKAHLITAVQNLVASGRALYFPAYELMMDELRDYRFYASDLVHPNELAVDYIWEKFRQVWIDEKIGEDMREVDAIRKGLAHRANYPDTEKHQKFIRSLEERMRRLQQKYPFMSF